MDVAHLVRAAHAGINLQRRLIAMRSVRKMMTDEKPTQVRDATESPPTTCIAFWKQPALHFAVIGTALYALVVAIRPAPVPLAITEPVVVPPYRIEAAVSEVERMLDRPVTESERAEIQSTVADQEVLYHYALQLGLDKGPLTERRLAQLATFVSENPHDMETQTVHELAREAADMGLNEGDLVVRRMLTDGARRLIRAAVMTHEPKEELLEAYLRDHPDRFRMSAQIRITQLPLGRVVREDDAEALRQKLENAQRSPEAVKDADPRETRIVRLPMLTERDLERRFGSRFSRKVTELPLGVWTGPIESRGGAHLVLVEEKREARVAKLEEVRKEVRSAVRQQLADEWLAIRLAQLREEAGIHIPQSL